MTPSSSLTSATRALVPLAVIMATTLFAADANDPLTVCQVVETLSKLDGKHIVLTGRFGLGDHGSIIAEIDRDECTKRPEQPAALELVDPSSAFVPDRGTRAVDSDNPHNRRFQELLNLYRSPPARTIAVDIVVMGEVIASRNVRIRKKEDKGRVYYEGNGYGFNGQFPAALAVTEIVSVSPALAAR